MKTNAFLLTTVYCLLSTAFTSSFRLHPYFRRRTCARGAASRRRVRGTRASSRSRPSRATRRRSRRESTSRRPRSARVFLTARASVCSRAGRRSACARSCGSLRARLRGSAARRVCMGADASRRRRPRGRGATGRKGISLLLLRGVSLLFELRAQGRQFAVRRVHLLKLAEVPFGLVQISRLDERGDQTLQSHLLAWVRLERASVLAYGALRVWRLVVEVGHAELRPRLRVVGFRRERVLVEPARVGERLRVSAVARDEEVGGGGHQRRLEILLVEAVRAPQSARNVRQDRGVALLPRVDVESLPDLLLQLCVGGACVRLRDPVLQLVVGGGRERVVAFCGGLRLLVFLPVRASSGGGGRRALECG